MRKCTKLCAHLVQKSKWQVFKKEKRSFFQMLSLSEQRMMCFALFVTSAFSGDTTKGDLTFPQTLENILCDGPPF